MSFLRVSVGSVTVISPLELIRTKMQSEKQSYRELSAVIRSALHSQGWRSLWRGWGPTLLRDVPFSGQTLTAFTYFTFWSTWFINTRLKNTKTNVKLKVLNVNFNACFLNTNDIYTQIIYFKLLYMLSYVKKYKQCCPLIAKQKFGIRFFKILVFIENALNWSKVSANIFFNTSNKHCSFERSIH